MAKLYSIQALRHILPLEPAADPLRAFFYPCLCEDGHGIWMFRYVVDSKGFWFQKNDVCKDQWGKVVPNDLIFSLSGLDLDDLERVPFDSNASQHPEVQKHPFRYGLPGGKPILPLRFTARQFFDWEKQCLCDEQRNSTETVCIHFYIFADELAELDKTNPEAAELARICLSGVRPEQQATAPGPAPMVLESASGGDDGWKAEAKKMAVELINRDREKDLYPSQDNLADEIAKKFRSVGVLGAAGKPLTGAYIKRHALNGISSAQGKQLSTANSRGK